MHYLLFYEKAKDYLERQVPFQEAHRDYVVAAAHSEQIVLAGNVGDQSDCLAVLLFKSDSPKEAERFAQNDPYVVHGIISRWYVKPWETVVGKDAAFPIPQ